MPSLSIVRMDFFKIAKWGAIIVGVLIAFIVIVKILLVLKNIFFPSPPPAPTVTFSKLPSVYFPEGINKKFTYEVDTISGELPSLSPSMKVYKMEQLGPDILAVQKASEKMTKLGFNPKPEQISDFVYKWKKSSVPASDLILNIKLSEFNLTSSFLESEDSLKTQNFSNKDEAITSATSFLKTLEFYPEEIDEKKTQVEFSKLNSGQLSQVTRAVDSNIATVYFFQKNKDEIPIVYPQGKRSSMKLVIGAGDLMGKVLDAKFSYQKVLDESSTYPIKTTQEAYDELKNGNAYIVSHNGSGDKVLIKNVYPAFYSEGKIQKYLTPVIVFEGNNDFLAYVPAVKAEWFEN
jgi:hypothetical protein